MKIIRYVSILIGLFAIFLFYLSLQWDSVLLFLLGIFLLLGSIFVNISYMVLDLYKKDREFNVEQLKNQGLTIVLCHKCNSENVKEDQYCRNCGEKLED